MKTLSAGGITVEVVRKRMKSIRLRVRPDGKAVLSAPYFVAERDLRAFLREREEWLKQAVARQAKPQNEVRLFGRSYPLRVETVPSRREEKVVFAEEAVVYRCESEVGDLLDREKRKRLTAVLETHVPVWEEKTGLRASSWQVRDMRTRWGSCTVKTGAIRFALKLAERSEEEIDCVILHELCHLAVPNHGDAFKALMTRHLPAWRKIQKGMKT